VGGWDYSQPVGHRHVSPALHGNGRTTTFRTSCRTAAAPKGLADGRSVPWLRCVRRVSASLRAQLLLFTGGLAVSSLWSQSATY
jgi:hypothetical protein